LSTAVAPSPGYNAGTDFPRLSSKQYAARAAWIAGGIGGIVLGFMPYDDTGKPWTGSGEHDVPKIRRMLCDDGVEVIKFDHQLNADDRESIQAFPEAPIITPKPPATPLPPLSSDASLH
jgi:hypothetical protein